MVWKIGVSYIPQISGCVLMAVRQRQRASLGIKSDLGKVTTCAPEVGEDLEMVDDDGGG
ncbi:hypothetical protein CFP56_007219 [Quercus suber]|uniref:Uncharacterized protein n=1 Tax=Quercus suber TaxID=58331 RepID=A0AAW0L5X5_QUESU